MRRVVQLMITSCFLLILSIQFNYLYRLFAFQAFQIHLDFVHATLSFSESRPRLARLYAIHGENRVIIEAAPFISDHVYKCCSSLVLTEVRQLLI
jgi:hypothetical protein